MPGRTFGTRDSPRDQGLPFQTLFQKITLVLKPEDHEKDENIAVVTYVRVSP